MRAAAEFLLYTGLGCGLAGLCVWQVLYVVAAIRDPERWQHFSWNLNRQWAARTRTYRAAAGFNSWGRVASMLVAIGVTCLIFAGLLTVVRLIANGLQA